LRCHAILRVRSPASSHLEEEEEEEEREDEEGEEIEG
jgi:hypothetical protein